jgi:hypothetical protein
MTGYVEEKMIYIPFGKNNKRIMQVFFTGNPMFSDSRRLAIGSIKVENEEPSKEVLSLSKVEISDHCFNRLWRLMEIRKEAENELAAIIS